MRQPLRSISGLIVIALGAAPALRAQDATLAPATPLRIVLEHRVRIHTGAAIRGRLTEPVYLVDHEVIPSGAAVSGTVRGTRPGPRGEHIRRLLAADFTPPRIPEIVFNSITVPANASHPEQTLQIDAPAVLTSATVLTLGTQQKRQSIPAQLNSIVKQRINDTREALKQHEITETVEKWAVGQLPYHPEILWSKTHFNAELASPVVVPDTTHPTLPEEDLRGRLPQGVLHARLVSGLSSQTAKRGEAVDAVITQPLLSPDRNHLLVPEGTHLLGVVVKTRAARSFGRNGDLRFAFRRLDLPSASGSAPGMEVHGRLSGAETAPGEHVTIDEEGQAKASNGPGRFAEPLVLAVLADVSRGDPDHRGPGGGIGPGSETVASNGFGLIARVVSLSTRNTQVLQGFAFYALAKSLYFNFIAKGHETTFPRDTEIQVTLSER
jgi:hypothetical protein